jgi:hypothetical protein
LPSIAFDGGSLDDDEEDVETHPALESTVCAEAAASDARLRTTAISTTRVPLMRAS